MAVLFIILILTLALSKDTIKAINNKAKRTKQQQDDRAGDLTQCDTMRELTEFIELIDEDDN